MFFHAIKFMGFISLLSSMVFASSKTYDFSASTIKDVKIAIENGDVSISPLSGSKNKTKKDTATVSVDIKKSDPKCTFSINLEENGALKISHKSTSHINSSCNIGLIIAVPANTNIQIGAGNCEVKTKEMTGNLKIDAGNATLENQGPLSDLKVVAGNLNLKAFRINGDALISGGSSNIDMSFLPLSKGKSRKVFIEFGYVKATIKLPKDSKIKEALTVPPYAVEIENKFKEPENNEDYFDISGAVGSGHIKIIPA